MTYSELKRAIKDHFANPSDDNSNRTSKCLTSLGKFMEVHKQTDLDNVRSCLSTDVFEQHLTQLGEVIISEDGRLQYAQELKSHLRLIHQIFGSLHSVEDILKDSKSISVVLRRLIQLNFKSIRDFSKNGPFPECVIRKYIAGKGLPSSTQQIEKLEKALRVNPGQLAAILPIPCFTRRYTKLKDGEGTRLRDLIQRPYRLKEADYPTSLRTEIEGYTFYKTIEFLPDGVARRKVWKTNHYKSGDQIPTALRFLQSMNAYFGYLLLPPSSDPALSGQGLDKSVLSLALYADAEKIRKYKQFHIARANLMRAQQSQLQVSASYTNLLADCVAMTDPVTGYLNQNFQMFGKRALGENTTETEWRTRCSDSHRKLYQDKKHLERSNKVQGRDPFKKIEKILDRDRPMDELLEAVDAVTVDVAKRELHQPVNSTVARTYRHADCAIMFRAILAIMIVAPFRDKNFRHMELNRHLYKKPHEQGWRIRFTPEEMKNYFSAAVKGGIDIELDPINKETGERVYINSKYIDDYIENVRSRRAFASTSNKVFLPDMQAENVLLSDFEKHGLRFADFVERMSGRYCPSGIRLNPHAFRHIIATHYIKTERNGVQLGAAALFDSEFTVRNFYARFNTQDKSKLLNEIRYDRDVKPQEIIKNTKTKTSEVKSYDIDPVEEFLKTFPISTLINLNQEQLEALVSNKPVYVRVEFLKRVKEYKRAATLEKLSKVGAA